jgi:hypothetical protein
MTGLSIDDVGEVALRVVGATYHMDMQTQSVRVDPLSVMEPHRTATERLNRQVAPDLFSGIA